MTDPPTDGKRDHATHTQRHHDALQLNALRGILTRLARGVAQTIYTQSTPPQDSAASPGPTEDTQA